MIDRPKGKIEKMIDCLYTFCGNAHEKAKTEKAKKWIRSVAALASVTICGFLIVGYVTPETVTVTVDTSREELKTVYETTARNVERFIEEHGIDYIDGVDELNVELDDRIKDNMKIRVTKAFDIKVTADGETTKLTTLPITAGEVIDQLGIKVGKDDILEPSRETELASGDQVVVKRVTFGKDSELEVVEYDVVHQAESAMTIGDMQLTQEGENGKLKKIYRVKYIDGKESERTLVETKTLKKVQDKIYSYGTDISFGDTPPSYEEKYSGVKAVSYYFSGNPRGAYGLPCTFGTCAVDPDVFPLGSLLYVEGYGYAIANDVGTSIKGKKIDLYMEKYEQCLMWGARTVNVYVVDKA